MWSPQLQAAVIRGLIIAVPTAILTTLTAWSQTDDAKTLIIAGATSLLSTFLLRSGVEGTYDTRRQAEGDVHPGDVVSQPAPAAAVAARAT